MPGQQLLQKTEAALNGGCKLIQYRNKNLPLNALIDEAGHLRLLCQRYGAHLVVNDYLTVAIQAQTHGVHLGQGDMDVAEARIQVGDSFCIGTTCHDSITLAQTANSKGADYVAFGRFFSSRTKATASAADVEIINHAKSQLSLPIVAIGGITQDNAALLIERGVDSVAVCHDLFHDNDLPTIENKARYFMQLFE